MFLKIGVLKTCRVIKKRLQRTCFPVNLRNFKNIFVYGTSLVTAFVFKDSTKEKPYSHKYIHWKIPVIVSYLLRLQASVVTVLRKGTPCYMFFVKFVKFYRIFTKELFTSVWLPLLNNSFLVCYVDLSHKKCFLEPWLF